jgi:hypothetical protein
MIPKIAAQLKFKRDPLENLLHDGLAKYWKISKRSKYSPQQFVLVIKYSLY